ncbi:hypothetical protein [Nonomuraea sp. NPDC048826]|uniref:hypothetical protein n=1 Tax=Nonomuraea sp. NPDC048826 TaxID=3364347 RepID=UPI00370F85A2
MDKKGTIVTDAPIDDDVEEAAALFRASMLRELCRQRAIQSELVAAAFAIAPRHLFTPGEPLEAAYGVDNAPIVKRDGDGLALSSVSAPHLQATMLEAAQVEPGMRGCEIGSGGYNAAFVPPGRSASARSTDGACQAVRQLPFSIVRRLMCTCHWHRRRGRRAR